MTNEELIQESPPNVLHFDAHEFDGLRDALDHEAKSLVHKGDQFIRDHPWVCMGVAVLAGMALGRVVRGSRK